MVKTLNLFLWLISLWTEIVKNSFKKIKYENLVTELQKNSGRTKTRQNAQKL